MKAAPTTGRILLAVFVVGVLFRLSVFAYAAAFPISNEDGAPTSPLEMQSGTDINFYTNSFRKYANESLADLYATFMGYYGLEPPGDDTNAPVSLANLRERNIQYFLAPPVFPLLIGSLDYRPGHTIPLALVYLGFSILLLLIWLVWLREKGLGPIWLLGFALLPNPVWFMVSITSDLPFALWFGAFFFVYAALRGRMPNRWRVPLGATFLILCLLTRASAVSVVVFAAVDITWRAYRNSSSFRKIAILLCTLGAIGVASFLMAPHFLIFSRHGFAITYFGVPQSDYLVGIFQSLPSCLDLALSWIALAGSKLLYFVGLRPPYGEISVEIALVRAAAGLVLLPGLFFLFLRAPWHERLIVFLFLVPMVIGASQDRYNLPIQPILFFWGAMAWCQLWKTVRPTRTSALGSERSHPR